MRHYFPDTRFDRTAPQHYPLVHHKNCRRRANQTLDMVQILKVALVQPEQMNDDKIDFFAVQKCCKRQLLLELLQWKGWCATINDGAHSFFGLQRDYSRNPIHDIVFIAASQRHCVRVKRGERRVNQIRIGRDHRLTARTGLINQPPRPKALAARPTSDGHNQLRAFVALRAASFALQHALSAIFAIIIHVGIPSASNESHPNTAPRERL